MPYCCPLFASEEGFEKKLRDVPVDSVMRRVLQHAEYCQLEQVIKQYQGIVSLHVQSPGWIYGKWGMLSFDGGDLHSLGYEEQVLEDPCQISKYRMCSSIMSLYESPANCSSVICAQLPGSLS